MSSSPAPAEPASFPLTDGQIAAYAARAPRLGQALQSDELRRIVVAYRREDGHSIAAQQRFREVATALNGAVLATAGIGALILVVGVLMPVFERWSPGLAGGLSVLLGIVGLLVGGYASARLYELNGADLAGDWMRSRARAEKLRGEYFERLAARLDAAEPATRVAALDLAYAHLLEDQLAYFSQRGRRHEEDARRWLRRAALATGVASVGVAAGGVAGLANDPAILALAAVGSIGSAFVAFAAGQEQIGQERERAQRFRNNVDALELLAREVGDLRDAIAGGSPDALRTFTAAVNQQLSLELGRFLEGGESVKASLAKLAEQIEASRRASRDGRE